jgi:uncharacterized protein YycO
MRALSLFVTILLLFSCGKPDVNDVVQDGDIIFQVSESSQSKAIQLATHSKYSHCGVIFRMDDDIFVVEAIQPVQSTPLKDWIARGKEQHYVVKRLKDSDNLLKGKKMDELKKAARIYAGKDYDLAFEWSNDKMYCSELVWKIYHRGIGLEIGKLQKLNDFDLSSPIVRKKLAERYGKNIPYNEQVISPAAIYESNLLENVISN